LLYINKREPPIIHYDIQPANILFDADGNVSLTDLGPSKKLEELREDRDEGATVGIQLTSQGAGTYWYLPPECFVTTIFPKISSKVRLGEYLSRQKEELL